MANAHDVAAVIERRYPSIGPLGLQKLAYYAQGWSLAWTGRPLFDDVIQAWPKGPVVAPLWHDRNAGNKTGSSKNLDREQTHIIDAVLDHYGWMPDWQLVEKTHEEDPWYDARDGLPAAAQSDAEITKRAMRDWFTARAIRGDSPKYAADVRDIDPKSTRATARRLARDWKTTLDILAR